MSWICELCGLDPPPSENKTTRVEKHFDSDQGSSSYLLPDLNDRIASSQTSGMEKRWLKKLPYLNTRLQQYYHFQADDCSHVLHLSRCITELTGSCTFKSTARSDVSFTSSETRGRGCFQDTFGSQFRVGLVVVGNLLLGHFQFTG